MAVTPAQFARMLPAALQHAVHKCEVAVVGLPGDVAASPCAASPGASGPLPSHGIYRPLDGELRQLAEMIGSAERITVFCGIGARAAHDEVVRLAAMLKAPVAYTFKAKMEVQYDNPYEIGMTGLLGLPSAYGAMHESDLLLLLGTDFPYDCFLPSECRIAQVDIRPERIGRRARVELGLAGDVKDTLQALLPMLRERSDRTFRRPPAEYLRRRVRRHYRRARGHGHEQSETPPRTGLTGAARLLFRRGGFVRPVGVENSVKMVYLVAEAARLQLLPFVNAPLTLSVLRLDLTNCRSYGFVPFSRK